jgi:hypothetical protein
VYVLEKTIVFMIVASLLAASAGVAAYLALGGQHKPPVQQHPQTSTTIETTTAPNIKTHTAASTTNTKTPATHAAQTQTSSQTQSTPATVRSLPRSSRDIIRCYPLIRANYSTRRPGGSIEEGYMIYRLEKSDEGYVLALESENGKEVKLYLDGKLENVIKIVMPNGYVLTGSMASTMGKRMLDAIGNMVKSLSVDSKLEIVGGKIVSPDGKIVIIGSPVPVKVRINSKDYEAYRVTIKTPASTEVDHSEILIANINSGVWMIVGVKSYHTDGTVSSWAITNIEVNGNC